MRRDWWSGRRHAKLSAPRGVADDYLPAAVGLTGLGAERRVETHFAVVQVGVGGLRQGGQLVLLAPSPQLQKQESDGIEQHQRNGRHDVQVFGVFRMRHAVHSDDWKKKETVRRVTGCSLSLPFSLSLTLLWRRACRVAARAQVLQIFDRHTLCRGWKCDHYYNDEAECLW